ncbi:motility-associated protein, partial [Shewanella electrica]
MVSVVLAALWQPAEMIIIFGAAIGALVAFTPRPDPRKNIATLVQAYGE